MNKIIQSIGLLALVSCDQLIVQPATDGVAEIQPSKEEEFKQRMEKAVRYTLKDPGSAQFRNMFAYPSKDIGCGEVNARNSFGGYTGFDPFVMDGTALISLSDNPKLYKAKADKCLAAAFQLEVEIYEGEKRDLVASADKGVATQERIAKLDKRIQKARKHLSDLQ